MRQTGTVSKWIGDRGFGFLRTGTGEEFFVHFSALELDRDYLNTREEVTFDAATGDDGRKRATNVRLVKDNADAAIAWIQP